MNRFCDALSSSLGRGGFVGLCLMWAGMWGWIVASVLGWGQ